MEIFDKAQWHIDAGMSEQETIERFQKVFQFLEEHELLKEDGKELLEFGIDSSISLHERLVNQKGKAFLEKYYDEIVDTPTNTLEEVLERFWKEMPQEG